MSTPEPLHGHRLLRAMQHSVALQRDGMDREEANETAMEREREHRLLDDGTYVVVGREDE